MAMLTSEIQKQLAIDQHSQRAVEFAERYQRLNENAYRSCFAYSRKRLSILLESYLPHRGTGLRLLDVGCGTGHHMASLRDRGFEVTGIDGSGEMLDQARANNPGSEIRQADVESLPFEDGSFDFVLCIEVLRYLPNPEPCIKEMARVLKPGGVCLATASPSLSLNGYLIVNRIANRRKVGNFVQLKQFFTTSHRLRADFERSGFHQTSINGVYLGPVNWVERLAPSILPGVLRFWERLDKHIADQPLLREFSNMFLAHAIKRA